MSVDIKTPTRTQFERVEFQCGEKQSSPLALQNVNMAQSPKVKHQVNKVGDHGDDPAILSKRLSSERRYSVSSQQKNPRKRKMSERGGGERGANLNNSREGPRRNSFTKPGRHGRSAEKNKKSLPRKFLLGGNITDPLNLNSLCDDDIGRLLNETTPQSSPLPLPSYKNVQVLIPPNINDPLNLNAGEEELDLDLNLISPKLSNKKKKHKHKKRKSVGETDAVAKDLTYDDGQPSETEPPKNVEPSTVHTDPTMVELERKVQKMIADIVSPDVPQSKKPVGKRMSSESASESSTSNRLSIGSDPGTKMSTKPEKNLQHKPSRQSSQTSMVKQDKNPKFVHGNYNRYYGYRNQEVEDPRLKCFQKEWFEGKDVLDIGCNIGHVTLSLARDFQPRKILGIDIDGKLIAVARKNVRHYLSNQTIDTSKFPVSLPLTYGPIAVPEVPASTAKSAFPHNVMFMQGNYVLEKDEELDMQCEEYDVILALSITKWIHLNSGDAGLKRAFQRMFRQLRPGGKLILEPQSWTSYKRKKKLSDTIFKNFQQIKLKPDRFRSYLLSVGFSKCEFIQMSHNKAKGFQRPIQIYTKPEAPATPWDESKGVTPLMEIECTPSATPLSTAASCNTPYKDYCSSRGATPKFEIGSTGITPTSSCPNTPSYMYNTWSEGGTPRHEQDLLLSSHREEGHGFSRRVFSTGFIQDVVEFHIEARDATPETRDGGDNLVPKTEPASKAVYSTLCDTQNSPGNVPDSISMDPKEGAASDSNDYVDCQERAQDAPDSVNIPEELPQSSASPERRTDSISQKEENRDTSDSVVQAEDCNKSRTDAAS